jgi:hypothetical protein
MLHFSSQGGLVFILLFVVSDRCPPFELSMGMGKIFVNQKSKKWKKENQLDQLLHVSKGEQITPHLPNLLHAGP